MVCGQYDKKGHEEHLCVNCGRTSSVKDNLPCPPEIYEKCKKECMWIPKEEVIEDERKQKAFEAEQESLHQMEEEAKEEQIREHDQEMEHEYLNGGDR